MKNETNESGAKAPAASGAVTHPPTGLGPRDVERLVARLVSIREELLARRDAHLSPARGGDETSPDEMDHASRIEETSLAIRLAENEDSIVQEIDDALARAKAGTYGLCEGTGEPIGLARLEAQPWARFSIAYAESLEREAKERRRRGG